MRRQQKTQPAALTPAPVTEEDWQLWLENPVTRWTMAGLLVASEQCQTMWQVHSWVEGRADPMLLQELRVRSDAYRSISEVGYERLCELTGTAPRKGE